MRSLILIFSLSLFVGLSKGSAQSIFSSISATEGGQILVPDSISKVSSFEPSGLIYLRDLKKYLVVSDDTNKAHAPFLFLMSETGKVDPLYLTIPGLPEISDIESVSTEGQHVYVLSSLSLTKEGLFKDRRNLLVRFELEGLNIKAVEKIFLGAILRETLKASSDPWARKIVSLGLDQIDIEAHAVKDNELYLALKAPFDEDGGSFILKISNLDELFQCDTVAKIELVSKVNFPSFASQYQQQVTDLIFVKDAMVLATTCVGKRCGGIWKINSKSNQVELIKFFLKIQPEGVAFNPENGSLMVTFDQGNEPSRFTVLKL